MTVKAMLEKDNLDDRREVYRLLERLPPAMRLRWLRGCCAICTLPNSQVHPEVPPNHSGAAMECFFDMWELVRTYDLDADRALRALVRMVRPARAA